MPGPGKPRVHLTFVPGGAVPREDDRVEVGTAGSTTALSLAVLPVLATAAGPVRVELVGGLFYFNYPGGTGLMSGAVFGRLAGTAAGHAVTS